LIVDLAASAIVVYINHRIRIFHRSFMPSAPPQNTSNKNSSGNLPSDRVVIRTELHRDWIDPHAFGIVKALQKGGHTTYLVGGCVRDLLIGIHPKDYDIATSAHPPQVKKLIYMAFIIGKRFRLVLVKREEQQYEVATFRREFDPAEFPEGSTQPMGDNVFGTPEQDALRRDFTINALFYDPIEDELIDYAEGKKDIDARILRMIGDPKARLIEDPIRILRALRLSHKIEFSIEPALRQAISENASELARAVLPRRREEILKFLRLDDPMAAFMETFDLGVMKYLIPTLDGMLQEPVARDSFFLHFAQLESCVKDPANPVDCFARLIAAMLKACEDFKLQADTEASTPPEWYISNESNRFEILLQDELGLFRYEQAHFSKAMSLQSTLARAEEFKRKGERRQLAVMRDESFDLALRLAKVFLNLTAEDIGFWNQAQSKQGVFLAEYLATQKEKGRKRRPRRGRNRGPKPEGGGETADVDDADLDGVENDMDDPNESQSDLRATGPDTEPGSISHNESQDDHDMESSRHLERKASTASSKHEPDDNFGNR
jgi:poly(A) polymerase